MAELSKQALVVDNNQSFPNNNNGAITPSILRAFNTNIIDSTVNQTQYTADSASFNSQIAAISGAVAPDTGSLLVTASAVGNVMTFTKANASTFNVTVGSVIPTGTISGSSQITGLGFVSSSVTASSLVTASFSGNTLTFTKGDSSTFGVTIPDVSGSTIPTGTVSGSEQITALGFVSSSVTGSSLVTGSVVGNVLTFTKGDATQFSLTVATGSGGGGTIDTGSFATTGSNNFIGDQTITGSVNISGGEHLYIKREIGGAQQELRLGSTDNLNNFAFIVTGSDQNPGQQVWGINIGGGVWANSFDAGVVFNSYATASQGLYVGNGGGGTLNAPLQNGYVWVGNGSDRNTTAPTSSFGGSTDTGSLMTTGSISGNVLTFTKGDASTFTLTVETGSGGSTDTGSLLVTASFSGNTLTFTKGDNSTFGVVIPDVSGSTIDTGSFATTGSNNFKGVETIGDVDGVGTGEVYLLGRSGSLVLGANGLTPLYSALAHLSSSQVNTNVNLIFKTNNNTADTIISGSSNIFTNPAAPTAGFKRYVGGSGNIMLNASNVPQISGSMGFSPVMNNNYFGGNGTTLTMRGPVSSSTYTISGNQIVGTVNIGQTAVNNAEKLQNGLNLIGNSIAGTLNINANQVPLTGSATTFSNNILNGLATLNLSSSAALVSNNNINDANFTFTNGFSSGSVGRGTPLILRNTIGGQGNQIIITGSQQSPTTGFGEPVISNNILLGRSNILFVDAGSARVSGSSTYQEATSNAVLGNNLILSGSNLFADLSSQGSVFVGRFNANDAIRNKTSDIVFAVGTGNTTTRKTGFHIDSGSNTFVEGTLNVSGSTSTTGSITIQSGSGDLFVHGNKQFNGAQYSSLVTQSGSAAVSQSITFDTTGPEFGVSLVDNTKLTVANSGTYNIQFSAQLLADTGADSVYIWFKKNGTNIAGSASELAIANNDEALMTVNILDTAAASDYYEICWQSTNGDAVLLSTAASGNVPSIPSIITTVTQVR